MWEIIGEVFKGLSPDHKFWIIMAIVLGGICWGAIAMITKSVVNIGFIKLNNKGTDNEKN